MEVNMKRNILPFNTNVIPKIYTHEGFINGIISANICNPDNTFGELYIDNYTRYDWMERINNVNYKAENNRIIISGEKYSNDMYFLQYRNCNYNDEIVIKIINQQYLRPWASVNIFIYDHDVLDENNKSKWYMRRFSDGRVEVLNGKDTKIYPNYFKIKNLLLKLEISDFCISYYLSDNNRRNWALLDKIKIPSIENLKIAFSFVIDENEYYNWLFSNHIQLRIDNNLPIEYFCHPCKSWKYYSVNPFLKYTFLRHELISKKYINNFIKFVIDHIDNYRYIEIYFNEKYLPTSNAYINNVEFTHQQLIYGYNKEKKIIYLIGYDNGYIKEYEVTFDEFQLLYLKADEYENRIIYLIEFNPDSIQYCLNLDKICRDIEDYLNGKDRIYYYDGFSSNNLGKAGITIYDEFINNEQILNKIFFDIRYTYILREHKELMIERLIFLNERKIIANNEFNELYVMCGSLLKLSTIIINLVIKIGLTNEHIQKPQNKIKDYLKELRQCDIEFMNKLYYTLTSKLKL
jgi:hypothetical protein